MDLSNISTSKLVAVGNVLSANLFILADACPDCAKDIEIVEALENEIGNVTLNLLLEG